MKIYVNVLLLHTYVFKKCVTYCGLIFDLNHNIHEYVHGCICVQMCVCVSMGMWANFQDMLLNSPVPPCEREC